MVTIALTVLLGQAVFQPISAKMSGPYIAASVHTSDGKEHLFLVDSGSNESYVLKSAVSDHDKTRDISLIRLDIGSAQLTANARPVSPETIPVAIRGLQIDGVLGINLLKQIQLEIDYDSHSVWGRYGGAMSWAGAGFTPLLMEKDPDNLYTVTAKIGEKAARLCVDTGATAILLDEKKIDTKGFQRLPSSRMHSFSGDVQTDRFLLESVKLGDHDCPWIVASGQIWKDFDSDDGIVATNQLGGSHVVIDFPGNCIYVGNSDPLSEAAARLLGIPVRIDSDSLVFRDGLGGLFESSKGSKIVAIHGIKSETIIGALRQKGSNAMKTLVDAFTAMRGMGLITTERGNERQILPMQVDD